jgi:hypothetical protein
VFDLVEIFSIQTTLTPSFHFNFIPKTFVMITKPHFLLFMLGMMLFACSRTNEHSSDGIELNEQGQEDFYAFIDKFNKDKEFQISRIEFPYFGEFMDYDDEYENYMMNSKTVTQSEYEPIDFGDIKAQPLAEQEYTIKVDILPSENAAFIIYQGNDNGIYVTFEFINKEGKWYFIGFSDSSM